MTLDELQEIAFRRLDELLSPYDRPENFPIPSHELANLLVSVEVLGTMVRAMAIKNRLDVNAVAAAIDARVAVRFGDS